MNFYKQLTSMPLEELAKWIDEHGQFDDSPWMKWFDQRYCSICPAVEIKREDSLHTLGFEPFYGSTSMCAYCEVHKKCKYFPDMAAVSSNTDIIEMWLKEEVK